MLAGFDELVNKGGGPHNFGVKANPTKLKFGAGVIIKRDGHIAIEEDPTSRYYLQIKPGTEGSNLGAGLFTK